MDAQSGSVFSLSGSKPGVLDQSQPARLLRTPNSTLTFATFDPRTALPFTALDFDDFSNSRLPHSARRVVIEISPSGESTWRFVPRAHRDPSVADEGTWPRFVEVFGRKVLCSQDQWDIHKLDTAYECHVRAHPDCSIITLVHRKPQRTNSSPSLGGKRRLSVSPNRGEGSSKKQQIVTIESEEETQYMDIDENPTPRSIHTRSISKPDKEQNRKARRERSARRIEKLERANSDPYEAVEQGKRKASFVFDSVPLESAADSPQNHNRNSGLHPTKRVRTDSPETARRILETRRAERAKQKKVRQDQELEARRNLRHQIFMADLMSCVPEPEEPEEHYPDSDIESEIDVPPPSDDPPHIPDNEEAARQAAIAESRRKLAELEQDRPLWEAAAKERQARERAEDQERRETTARRQAAAEAEKQTQAHQAEEATYKEEETRRSREGYVRREREKLRREQRQWTSGPWTTFRALERYKSMSENFDRTKFCVEVPLTFEAVPWPVLHSPTTVSVEDIDWTAVEIFFASVQPLMRYQDYTSFVEKAHRRMHPDRWRSRGLLKSVLDEEERNWLEIAANTVAQAVTPIWTDLKNN